MAFLLGESFSSFGSLPNVLFEIATPVVHLACSVQRKHFILIAQSKKSRQASVRPVEQGVIVEMFLMIFIK